MKRWLVPSLGVLLIAILAGGLIGGRSAEVTYHLTPLERGSLVTTVWATGKLSAEETVEVSSQLSGQLAELYVDFNDEVRKGQAIAQLDPAIFSARVEAARSALELARADLTQKRVAVERALANFDHARSARKVAQAHTDSLEALSDVVQQDLKRRQELFEKGNVAASALEKAEYDWEAASANVRGAREEQQKERTNVLMAETDVRIAEVAVHQAMASVEEKRAILREMEVELERSTIRAPIDGIVIKRDVEKGQTVAASLEAPTLFTIAKDLKSMEVHAKVDEADIGQIRPGQRARFTVDSYPTRPFSGNVVQIRKGPEEVQNVVVYTVVISSENPDLLLLPGMTASVQIVARETSGVLKVPNAALRFNPPGANDSPVADLEARQDGSPEPGIPATVWSLNSDGNPVPLRIHTGDRDDGAAEVLAGPLGEGDQVIVGASVAQGGTSLFGLRFGF